jgi:hypothetical protein
MAITALEVKSETISNQSGTPGGSRDRFLSNPAHRADFSGARSGSLLAHNQRMGYRALRLDYVRCVSHFGTELCGSIRRAEIAAAWNGSLGRMGLGILLICVIGATGVGIFRTDPNPFHFPLSTRRTLHVIFGTSRWVLLPFAALLINLSLARNNEAWRSAWRVLLWTAGLPLFGFLSFAVYSAIFCFFFGTGCLWPRC